VQSESQDEKAITEIHRDLLGDSDLKFSKNINDSADVIFVCSGHGKSKAVLQKNDIDSNTKIIDLSNDFRLKADATFNDRQFIYGLPEFNKTKIIEASNIANPGCFATAIQLALLPLFAYQQVKHDVHINAITGSTGAGQSLLPTTHFTWRSENISVYKPFTHQHLGEISETFQQLQPDFDHQLNFIPVRGNFTRGIFASVYTSSTLPLNEIIAFYNEYYSDEPFTHVSTSPINMKQVVNTNKCLIHVEKHNDKVLICSSIDNLVKGASGQAVQNMNLIFGLSKTVGLGLKPSAF
jgi:N-acetyl-gamma-glutamyl-phosphate reductase